MRTHFTLFSVLCRGFWLFLFLQVSIPTYAFQVYVNTGHKVSNEWFQRDANYSYTAANVHGLWLMPWTWRNELNDSKRKKIIHKFTNNQMVVEIEMRHMEKGIPDQLVTALKAGANVHTLMFYNEKLNYSTINQQNLNLISQTFGDKYKLVSNCRWWSVRHPSIFNELDGVCFETQVPEKKIGMWKQAAEAAKWAIDNGKHIYLLTPAGHNMAEQKGDYLEAYKKFFHHINKELGELRMKSPLLVFVPANYNFDKTQVHLTPETQKTKGQKMPTNTLTGVTYWLLQQDHCSKFFDAPIVPQKNVSLFPGKS